MAARKRGHYVLDCGRHPTGLGWATLIQVERFDGRRMGWEEIHRVFARRHPGRWALQAFPPPDATYNGANKYHLWVLDERPAEIDLGELTKGRRTDGRHRATRRDPRAAPRRLKVRSDPG